MRIDVHQHVVPPFWAKELPSHGGDPSGAMVPAWSPAGAISFMDSQGIATGVLSLGVPGVVPWYESQRREMARRINDYTATLVSRWPDRFGNFATLPLPDLDGALREIEYAFETLRVDGVVLLANVAGRYLGDAYFERLWHELDRRRATVLLHPNQPPLRSLAGVAGPLVDFPFDVTRAAVQLVLNGVVERFPNVRVILAHAGGLLPGASKRIVELALLFGNERCAPEQYLKGLRSFFFETTPLPQPEYPGATRTDSLILFGSDFPYAAGIAATSGVPEADDELDAARMRESEEAQRRLFPRLYAARA